MWTNFNVAGCERVAHWRLARVGIAICAIFMMTACQHITTKAVRPIERPPSPPIVMDGGFCNGNIESIRLFFRTGSVIPADDWKERIRELIDNARCGPLRSTDTIIAGFDNQDGEIESSVLMRNLNGERGRMIFEYLLSRGIKRFAVDMDSRPGLYEVDHANRANSPTGAYVVLHSYRCNSQKCWSRHFDSNASDRMIQENAKDGRVETANGETASW